MLSAKLFLSDPDDSRGAERLPIDAAATMRDTALEPIAVVVRDLSATGMRLDCDRRLGIGQRIRIGISGVGMRMATVIRHDDDYGCTFDGPLEPGEVRAAEGADTVVPFGEADGAMPEPEVAPYPRWLRAGLLVGISLGGWWLILMLLG